MRGERLIQANKKAKRLFYIYHIWGFNWYSNLYPERKKFFGFITKENMQRTLGSYRKTSNPCSCYACGNPRKWFNEPTLQEKRWFPDYEYEELIGR